MEELVNKISMESKLQHLTVNLKSRDWFLSDLQFPEPKNKVAF